MTEDQLVAWIEYWEVTRFGHERRDRQAGMIASAIYNVHRSKSSDRIMYAHDFIMKFGPDAVESKPELGDMTREKFDEAKMKMKIWAKDLKKRKKEGKVVIRKMERNSKDEVYKA